MIFKFEFDFSTYFNFKINNFQYEMINNFLYP